MFSVKSRMFFVTLMVLSVLGQFATELYLPSMPAMAKSLSVPINLIQLTIAVYVFGYAIGSLIYGTLSDKYGRKSVIFVCLVIGSVGSLICCVSFSIKWLFIGRVIQGLGFSGVAVVIRSITKDISPDKERLAKLASVMGILYSSAIAFAPIIGGYVQKYLFWRMSFILLLLMSIGATAICWYKMPETIQNKRDLTFRVIIADYIDVLSNKQFLLYNAISAMTLSGVLAYQTVSSFLLQVRVGMAPDHFGYTSLVVTGALLIGSVVNRKMIARRGLERILYLGSWLYITAGLIYVITGLFHYTNVVVILVPMVLYMYGAGMVYPNCSSGAMSIFDTKAGTAASVYNCFQMIGATVGSTLISMVHDTNQFSLGVLLTGIGLLAMIFAQVLQIRVIKQVAKI